MEINGKVYRNLEGQVGYLTDKYDDLQNQINDVRAHLTHYVEVDQLPTGDDIDTSAVYLLGPMGTAPDQYYEEWVYVQKADESWVWEKLGDTDSVDLSGYLQKQTGATDFSQVYAKLHGGTQGMLDVTSEGIGATIVFRDASGRISVAAPSTDGNAANKKYCDDGFVAKQTGATAYGQAYGKTTSGAPTMWDVDQNGYANTIVLRGADGRMKAGADPTEWNDVLIKHYSDSYLLAKQTGTTTHYQVYTKASDGSQAMMNISKGIVDGALVVRDTGGQINVPETPTANGHAASKAYVDSVVGQLLYLHDIYIDINIDASNHLFVQAQFINSSSTALTSIDRTTFRRMEVEYGAFGAFLNGAAMCSVTKMPTSLRQDELDEPTWGFLYQYFSGGNLVSGFAHNAMIMTVIDRVESF